MSNIGCICNGTLETVDYHSFAFDSFYTKSRMLDCFRVLRPQVNKNIRHFRDCRGQLFATLIECELLFFSFSEAHSVLLLLLSFEYSRGSGGRLPETKNKRICQISGLKSGHCRLRNLWSDRFRENVWNIVWVRNKTRYLQSGRLREVVAIRELTVFYR